MIVILNNKEDFEKEIAQGNTVVDFFATWCGPCRMMGQIMENIETEFPTVKFLKVDVDKFPEIAAKFNISSIPDMYFFKDGKKIEVDSDGEKENDLLGARPEETFRDILTASFGL